MSLPKTADIVIVGGGVIGMSTAYHLAASGQPNILLLEREDFFGAGATGRCAGGIRYQFATEVNIRLSQESLPMLARFEREHGQAIDHQECGYMFLLKEERDLNLFRRNVALQHRLGVQTEWLEGDEVRRRLPIMELEDIQAGTFHAKDGLADPNGVVMGYLRSARSLGVDARTGVNVEGLQIRGNRITGVDTKLGQVAAPIVVNAAGPWARPLGTLAGVEIPVSPVRRQMVTTTPLPEVPPDLPFVIDFSRSLYFHREGQGVLTGMSNPDQPAGFDQSVDPDWEMISLEAAMERMPILEKAGMAGHWAGLYEVTPDAHPIFGRTPVEGLYICAGFSGHGFMHGPIAGKLMSEIILDGASRTVDVSILDLDRFAEGRLIHEYNVV